MSIGIAETIVPNVYLPKQFWEAPFAAGIFGFAIGLAPIMTRVDFVVGTALRFLAIIRIIALMALYIRYRSIRREVDEQRDSSSLCGVDEGTVTSHEEHQP